jgi:hypothetical protein
MDVFESTKDLVEEVLYELFFERARGEETVEIGAEELGDEVTVLLLALFRGVWGCVDVHVLERGNEDVAERDDLDVC